MSEEMDKDVELFEHDVQLVWRTMPCRIDAMTPRGRKAAARLIRMRIAHVRRRAGAHWLIPSSLDEQIERIEAAKRRERQA